jgi:hypothetical protein
MVHSFSKGKQTRCQNPTKRKKKQIMGLQYFFSSDHRIYATITTTNPNKKKKKIKQGIKRYLRKRLP